MREFIDKLIVWCKYHKVMLIIILLTLASIFGIFYWIIIKYNEIVFNFPLKDSENIKEYYTALSQLYGGIIGGIIGGFFTVLGVGITVYFANVDRKNDLKKADKPRLLSSKNIDEYDSYRIVPTLCTINEFGNNRLYTSDEIKNIKEDVTIINFEPFSIYVTNNADCILEGIILNEEMIYDFDNPYILKKDKFYTFDLSNYYFVNKENNYDSITIICTSLEERRYYFTCSVDNRKEIYEGREIIKSSIDFLDERIYNYDKKIKKLEKKLDYEFIKHVNDYIKEKRNKQKGSD